MTNTQVREIAERLEKRRQELTLRLERVKQDVGAEHSPDWSEQAQERQNDEVIDAIGNEARDELGKITRALERIAADEYGLCAGCGEAIDSKRLAAVPYADLCIRCASC